ncbi:galactokinase [Calothrix sp. NIES-4101]|nr:galactokinase [Calothrix sp. NIES-4101]
MEHSHEFQNIFNQTPETQAYAHGRVNLLGEHTDYNDGYVLPIAIPQKTTVQLGFSLDEQHHIYSQELNEKITIFRNNQPSGFASYIFGCIELLQQAGYQIPSLNLYIKSSIPIGSGLSSSAALEVATLRGIRQLLNLPINDVEIAQFAQQAEINYAGVQCGIMDQMASSLADTQHMLFLDTRTLARQILSFPALAEILIIHSGCDRTLAGSKYNQRRSECQQAAHLLGVKALRDIDDVATVEILPEPLHRRARHVVTENHRVLDAVEIIEDLQDNSASRFGELMNASHASLRNDYEVSVPALDTLVDILQNASGVFGAKLTGAGFGGACVALVASGAGKNIAATVLDEYSHAGYKGKVLVPE